MNPHLMTDLTLAQVLNELRQQELIFHRPEFEKTRQDFEQMTDPAFWEVGASGQRYSREYVLDTLEKRAQNPVEETWETQDFQCLELGAKTYLLTYKLIQGERLTRRSTIWRSTEMGWQILYHQGTIIENQ
jgi:hypothetical protein